MTAPRSGFEAFQAKVEAEARASGRLDELQELGAHFRLVAEFIRLRKATGMSQRALARASGVPQSEISRMERGLANPTWRTLEAVARASGMTLAFVPLPRQQRPRRPARAR
jgi:DNA-binding phage protein